MKAKSTWLLMIFLLLNSTGFPANETILKNTKGYSIPNNKEYDPETTILAGCPDEVTNNSISTTTSTTICAGETISFTGTEPSITPSMNPKFQWQSRTPPDNWKNIKGAKEKDYTTNNLSNTTSFRRLVEFKDCKTKYPSHEILITVNPTPPAPTISVRNNCGESVLTASNYSGTLSWSTGESTPSITVYTAGEYSLTQTVDGCTSDAATIKATPETIPVITSVTEYDPTVCQGQGSLDFTFTGVPNGKYTIAYDGGSFKGVVVSGNAATVLAPAGTYNNLIITVNGCSSESGVNASLSDPNPPPAPAISVQNDCGESVLTASNYTGSLIWSTGETTKSITVYRAGEYSVTQTVNKCTSDAATATATPKTIPVIAKVTENDPTVCEGQGSLELTFTGVPNGIYSISYNGSSFKNVTVSGSNAIILASAGNYNNLTITVNGCPSASGINANLSDPPPPPAPNISVQNNCGQSVLTASEYTGTLLWSTGESTESITVNTSGDYSVTQTIGGCTSDAATKTAKPKTIPVITGITEHDPTVCQERGTLDFAFTGVPNGKYTITYDGGSLKGVTVSENTATVEALAGTYNNLTITVNGCSSANGVNASLSDPIPPPAPTISVQNDCGESVLTASNYTGSLIWSTGETTKSITVYRAGEYSVTQTVNKCTSDAATATATPKTIPVIAKVTENDPTVCEGQGSLELTFTGVPNGIYSISYNGSSFKNVTVSGSNAIVLASAGNYNNLTITVNGCPSASGINANLSDPPPPPAPNISVQNNCGQSVLTASNYSGTLSWSTGENTESITVQAAGDYSVTQSIGSCTSSAATVKANPFTVPFPPTGNDLEICATDPFQPLIAEATAPDTYTDILWYDDVTGGNEILLPVLDTVGTVTYYAASQNSVNGCLSTERTPVTLTIKPNPKTALIDTAIIGKPSVNVAILIFPDASLRYQWYLNNAEITNAIKQYYYIVNSERIIGNVFTIEVELQNGCKAKFNYPYSGNSGRNKIDAIGSSELDDDTQSIKIYPNPVNNNLNIAVNSNDLFKNQKLNAKIYSNTGACIMETPLDKNPKNIDIRQLRPGIYSVTIYSSGNRLITKKLVVTKY